jgi:hypothetical protein
MKANRKVGRVYDPFFSFIDPLSSPRLGPKAIKEELSDVPSLDLIQRGIPEPFSDHILHVVVLNAAELTRKILLLAHHLSCTSMSASFRCLMLPWHPIP